MLPFRGLQFARQISRSARALKKGCPPEGEGEGQAKERGDGGCGCEQKPRKCQPKVPKKPKKAGLQCGTPGDETTPGPFRDSGVPDHCSKDKALECAKKLQELQKMWEAVAAASEPGARAAPPKKAGCPPRPPARDEGGASPAVLLLAGAALIAAVVWFVLNSQEGAEEGGEGGEANKEE